jgi:3-hydroxyisobutyrate dehydrogenase-like beta-hydroxyacid dehydrogenase
MKVALIGYGEVGRILAEDLVPRGHAVTAHHVKLGGEAGNAMREHAAKTTVMLAGSHAAAAQGAELVVSAATASQAVAVAQAAARALDEGAFFLDFNSASPGAKIRAAAIVNAAAVFGTKGTKEFARSTDWRVEADRI